MKALHIVNRLLEAEEPIGDPMAYALSTNQPVDLMRSTLRDELVERGWRHIRIEKMDENEWALRAGYVDENHRAQWERVGARVAPPPTEAPDLRMKLMRLFRAGAKRAGIQVTAARIEELVPEYRDGLDLHSLPDDFEADRGDWDVEIIFEWQPISKFWSKASQALGYK